MSHSQSASASGIRGCNDELEKAFWQQWQQYQDYLHRCCIKQRIQQQHQVGKVAGEFV
jgi:hypothetical protein